jgi:hypothetical protein
VNNECILRVIYYFNFTLGIGGCIHVFETQSGKFITREEIFEGQRVHNIFAGKNRNIAVIGGKMARIFKLEDEGNFM